MCTGLISGEPSLTNHNIGLVRLLTRFRSLDSSLLADDVIKEKHSVVTRSPPCEKFEIYFELDGDIKGHFVS